MNARPVLRFAARLFLPGMLCAVLLFACTGNDVQAPPPAEQLQRLYAEGVALSPAGECLLTAWLMTAAGHIDGQIDGQIDVRADVQADTGAGGQADARAAVRVLTAAEADLNADGLPDVVLIHTSREERGKMTLLVLLQQPDGRWKATNSLPAPVENQRISFRDIDEKPPLEFVVMGSKGIRNGIAVYRIVNERLVDLFSNGMDDCC